MCGIRYPKAGEPFRHGVIDIFQEGQWSRKGWQISQLYTPISNINKVFQKHFFEKSDKDAGFGKCAKKSGILLP
jgi:hypothetical protein